MIYFGVGKGDEDRADRQNALDKFTTKLQTLKLLASPEGKIEVPLIEVGGQILAGDLVFLRERMSIFWKVYVVKVLA